MSRQTDELMGIQTGVESLESIVNPTPQADIDRMRTRLRYLTDLKRNPGYAVLMDGLKYEAQHVLMALDRADNPTTMAKLSGNYYTLTQVMGYVDREIAQLSAMLINKND